MLETATLERVINDSLFTTFDWMTGVAPETIVASNHWDTRITLRASSKLDVKAQRKPSVKSAARSNSAARSKSAKGPVAVTAAVAVSAADVSDSADDLGYALVPH